MDSKQPSVDAKPPTSNTKFQEACAKLDAMSEETLADKMKDPGAMNKALEMVAKNKELIPLMLKKVEDDQGLKRKIDQSAWRIKREQAKQARQGKHNSHGKDGGVVNCPSKKDITQLRKNNNIHIRQEGLKESAKGLTGEEKSAIVMAPSGNTSALMLLYSEAKKEGKYVEHSTWIEGRCFTILSLKGIGGKKNKRATDLIDLWTTPTKQMDFYGPITFIYGDLVDVPNEDGTMKTLLVPESITKKVFDNMADTFFAKKKAGGGQGPRVIPTPSPSQDEQKKKGVEEVIDTLLQQVATATNQESTLSDPELKNVIDVMRGAMTDNLKAEGILPASAELVTKKENIPVDETDLAFNETIREEKEISEP